MKSKVKNSKNDIITNRIMLAVVAAFALLFLLFYLQRLFENTTISANSIHFATTVLPYICLITTGVCLLASAIYLGVAKMRRLDVSEMTLTPFGIFMFSILFFICGLVIFHFSIIGLKTLYTPIVILAVLYVISHIYRGDFSLMAVISAYYGVLLFLLARKSVMLEGIFGKSSLLIAIFAIFSLVPVAALVKLKLKSGVLPLFGDRKQLVPANMSYLTPFLFVAIYVLSLVCFVFFGPMAAFMGLIADATLIFLLAVYHTIRYV